MKDSFVSPDFFVLQKLLPFCRDISFAFSRHVLLSPFLRSLLVCTVSLDFPRFLSHSVADRLGPYCLFGGMYVTLSYGGLRPLVDGPVGWCAPRLLLLLFYPSHLGSDVLLFIEWEDVCIRCLLETEFGSFSYPLIYSLKSGLAVREVQ